MKWVNIYLLLSVCMILTACFENDAKFIFNEGVSAYNEGEFKKANNLFEKSSQEDSSYSLAYYNAGNSAYLLSEFEDAIENYENNIRLGNKKEKAASYYNRGNSFLKLWQTNNIKLSELDHSIKKINIDKETDIYQKLDNYLIKDSLLKAHQKLLDSNKTSIKKAIESYKSSLRINPKDEQARYNLCFAINLIPKKSITDEDENEKKEEKSEPTKFAIEQKKRAMELILENKFSEAYNLLVKAQSNDPSVNNYNELIEKLKVIADIIEN